MQLSVTHDVNGKTVIDGAGNAVGEVEDVLVDTDAWRVLGFRVKLRKEAADALGEPHGAFRSAVIPVPIEAVSAAGQTVVLNVPLAALRRPGEDASHAPPG